jgi:hypothetical protein
VSIADARDAGTAARQHIKAGSNPADVRRDKRTAERVAKVTTFAVVAAQYMAKDDTLAPRTVAKHQWVLSLLKALHARPIASIDAPQVLRLLERRYQN